MGKLYCEMEEFIKDTFFPQLKTFVEQGLNIIPVNVFDTTNVEGVLLTSKTVDSWLDYNASPKSSRDVVKNMCSKALFNSDRKITNEELNLFHKSVRAALVFTMHALDNQKKMMNFEVFANTLEKHIDDGFTGIYFDQPTIKTTARKTA